MFTTSNTIGEKSLQLLLGVTRTTLWKWRKSGMPATAQGRPGRENRYDLAGVLSWLQESGNQFDFRPASQTPDRAEVLRHEIAIRELARPDALAHAHALALRAADAIARGQFDFAMEHELRVALRAISVPRRDELEMDFAVWDFLCEAVLKLCDEYPDDEPEGALNADEIEPMGIFWYQVAAGEIVVANPAEENKREVKP